MERKKIIWRNIKIMFCKRNGKLNGEKKKGITRKNLENRKAKRMDIG